MLDRNDGEELLTLQSRAYKLLMWLADEATRGPNALSEETVAALQEPETAAEWLRSRRERLPREFMPDRPSELFAGLLSPFFSTSFHVRHLEFNGRLVEARVMLRATDEPGTRSAWSGAGRWR